MPKIFHVTVSRVMHASIVAESREELEQALANEEFDEWIEADDPWEVEVRDPLNVRRSKDVPRVFEKPDMGIVDSRVAALEDYADDYAVDEPAFMEKVMETAIQHAVQLALNEKNAAEAKAP